MMVGETSIEPHLCVTVLVYNGTKKVTNFVLFFGVYNGSLSLLLSLVSLSCLSLSLSSFAPLASRGVIAGHSSSKG